MWEGRYDLKDLSLRMIQISDFNVPKLEKLLLESSTSSLHVRYGFEENA
jgi:hypothetical protein